MNFFLLTVFLLPVLSQALEITAKADKTELAVNESFVFAIRIHATEEPENLDIPNLSNLNDFHLLGQWSGQESSIQIINGKMEKTNVFSKSYRFQPKTTGTLRIESLTIRANKKTFKTDPVFITVHKKNKSQPPAQIPKIPPFPLPDPFQIPNSFFDIFKDPFADEDKAKDSIKLQTNLSKKSVYKSEMIRVNWFLLQSSGRIRYSIYKDPSLKGFWKEEIKNKPRDPSVGTQVIDQILYRKTLLNSLWLFPLQTGQLTIDPFSIEINHLYRLRFQEKIYSAPIRKITVKELPIQGQDHTFTGAVGSFKVQATIKEQSAVVNQPLSYKITFKGSGHPRFISLPTLNFLSSFHTYPPVEKSQFSDLGQGTKEFEILVVPKQEGILNIPSWTLSTFDPKKEKYIFHELPAFSLPVKRGKTNQEPEGQTFFEEEKPEQKKVSLSLDPLNTSYWPQFINHKNLVKLWLILFGFFLIGLLVLYIKHFAFKKEKSLREKINQKLDDIQKLLDQRDWRRACTQMIHVNSFMLDAAQIRGTSSGWKEALNKLPPSLGNKYSTPFEDLFTQLENLSFSKKTLLEKEALDKTRNLLKQVKILTNSFLADL